MTFSRASAWRRLAAWFIDLVVPGAAAAVVALSTAALPYSPPGGWFWSEWLLKVWLDEPQQFLVPLGVFCSGWLGWVVIWEGLRSVSLGGSFMGLEVVTTRGRAIDLRHAAARLLGNSLNILSLGLGAALSLADPEGRALHDRLSATWVVHRDATTGSSANHAPLDP